MAAALHAFRNANMHAATYPGLDYQDIRYPNLSQRPGALVLAADDRSVRASSPANSNGEPAPRHSYPVSAHSATKHPWVTEQRGQQPRLEGTAPSSADVQSLASQSQQSQSQEAPRSFLQYALPQGPARRVLERYSLDDNATDQRASPRSSADTRPQDSPNIMTSGLRGTATSSPTPRHALGPSGAAGVGAKGVFSMPLSASLSYTPPVSSSPRALAQQPTYITPPTTPIPIRTVYSPQPPPPPPLEEICIECAMRDQDMADVDVTSPGVWDRESDAAFEELKQQELEDERNGVVSNPSQPRIRGGRLTEQNLKLWLSINPREPASRHQTLRKYIVSQRALLEAEALAHARAQQESRQLDTRVSRLRQSAYDLAANGATVADETGGLRIKSPRAVSSPHDTHMRSQSREIMLLENGLIMEQVDVRKEEREEKERRRKEERRARKSSRSSMTVDVNSIISVNSVGPVTDSGIAGLNSYPRSSTAFSDVHSLGSTMPKGRFFGAKNLNAGWRSQDSLAPSAMSGSMIDMHVALQREGPTETLTPRRSRLWSTFGPETITPTFEPSLETKKKKKGLAKLWGLVTGKHGHGESSTRHSSYSPEKAEDDGPLAPPPPLSYLVNRGPVAGDVRPTGSRHIISQTVQSLSSLKSNSLAVPPSPGGPPSPPLSRLSAADIDKSDSSRTIDEKENLHGDDTVGKSQSRSVHPVTSEPNMRRHSQKSPTNAPLVPPFSGGAQKRLGLLVRDKSLPPLPGEPKSRPVNNNLELRPVTVYGYDPRQRPPGAGSPHDFLPPNAPFRSSDNRRQSFSGVSPRPKAQTLPMKGDTQAGFDPRVSSFGPQYNEFGTSRRSLGQTDPPQLKTVGGMTKRKSKFGLSLFLGKKNNAHAHVPADEDAKHQFPLMQSASSGEEHGGMRNGMFVSQNQSIGIRPAVRLSMTSRKALEERVMQDKQFVAYRYPSNDQQLNLFR